MSIAAKLRGRQATALVAASALAEHPLAGRIRRILKLEDEPMRVSRRMLAVAVSLPLLVAATVYAAAAEDEKNSPPSSGELQGEDKREVEPADSTTAEGGANDPAYLVAYPAADLETVDFRRWMKLVAADPRTKVSWDDKKSSLVIVASRSAHKQIGEFLAETRDAADRQHPSASRMAPSTKSDAPHFYDGKTFEQWRDLWKQELKTENRTEAIKALAAFGRAGRGKEAAEAILDVAAEYDFSVMQKGQAGEDSLKVAVVQVLVGPSAQLIPAKNWLPSLLERLAKSEGDAHGRWRSLAEQLLSGYHSAEPEARALLVRLADDPGAELAEPATLALIGGDRKLADGDTVRLARAALSPAAPSIAVLERLSYSHLDKVPEQFELLFHADEEIQWAARRVFASKRGYQKTLSDRLLAILDDPQRAQSHHAAAILALTTGEDVWSRGHEAETRLRVIERLEQFLRDGDRALLVPAIAALADITDKPWEDVVTNMVEKTTSDERKTELQSALDRMQGDAD